MAAQPPTRQIPADVVNLEDYARHAQACLPEATWAYLSGGAADERVRTIARDKLRTHAERRAAGDRTQQHKQRGLHRNAQRLEHRREQPLQ